MPKAILKGTVLAESDRCERVEGNYYFPPESVNKEYFQQSDTHTSCPWKGQASYYTINLDGEQVKDGAWYYPDAKERAKNIEGYVAFYKNKGITIEE
jgi:uncharacterized protein (DUF427 family)